MRDVSQLSDSQVEAALAFDGVPLFSTFQTRTSTTTDDVLEFIFTAEDIRGQFGKWVSGAD